jgi:hypothetical protein
MKRPASRVWRGVTARLKAEPLHAQHAFGMTGPFGGLDPARAATPSNIMAGTKERPFQPNQGTLA